MAGPCLFRVPCGIRGWAIMAKKKHLSESERQLLQEAMQGVTPLHHDKVAPQQQKPDVDALMQRETAAVLQELAQCDGVDQIEAGEGLVFSRGGLPHRTLRDLRRGKFALQAELDLHGLTRDPARQAVVSFIAHCQSQGLRCVRIIHGKGLSSYNKQPVLKGSVGKWLTRCDAVLAFCSARPQDGGTGALYVLLRKGKA